MMRNFLLGVVVGAAAALWYNQTRGRFEIDRQFSQMQDRANAVLNESRRILEETRRELGSALEAGRQSFGRTERPRGSAPGDTGGPEPGESIPPSA